MRWNGFAANRTWTGAEYERTLPVERLAKGVDDTAEPRFVREEIIGTPANFRPCAARQAGGRAERHDQHPAVAEADNFGLSAATLPADQAKMITDANVLRQALDLDHQADRARHLAVDDMTRQPFKGLQQSLDRSSGTGLAHCRLSALACTSQHRLLAVKVR